jgi:glycosyltransferase involved in cell wall biosynthesis
MRVLHLTNMWPSTGSPHAGTFVVNMVEALGRAGVENDVLAIERWSSKLEYFRAIPRLRRKLKEQRYDLVHAQYAHSVLIACMQRKVPVVGHLHGELQSGHGSKDYLLAQLAAKATAHILVCDPTSAMRLGDGHVRVVPLGIDSERFAPRDRAAACKKLGLDPARRWVLFPSDPKRREKNYPLFAETLRRVQRAVPEARELVLCGRNYADVPDVMNAADLLLLTSTCEASPTVVKEALLCNLPVVSTNVGDVARMLHGVWPSAVTASEPDALAERAIALVRGGARSDGRRKEPLLNLKHTADSILRFYGEVLAGEEVRCADAA